ncbi:hypothetical protein J3E72DRAFT_204462, partial [Bipolaris maydis]
NHQETIMDPVGQIILRLSGLCSEAKRDLRVSTNVLRLASPVFTKMLSTSFREGQRLISEELPVIELGDDEPDVMELILRVLHFQGNSTDHEMTSERLAQVALHCDKYDLTRSLGPWVITWFRNVSGISSDATAFGFQVLAAYMFGDRREFRDISRAAVLQLNLMFPVKWKEEALLSILPISVTNSIKKRIQRVLNELEAVLQCMERIIRDDSRCYNTWKLLCTECGRNLPGEAKRCHPCQNTQLLAVYCTGQTRVAQYFDVLRAVELWPTVGYFAASSVSQISLRFTSARESVKHACEGGSYCPLLRTLSLISERAKEAQDWVNGLCLQCVREGEDKEDGICSHR